MCPEASLRPEPTSKRFGVVLAGGTGERFWPASTPQKPKQLLCLTDPSQSMIEEALHRLDGLFPQENRYISTTLKLSDSIKAAVPRYSKHLLAEPEKRNTLGAIVWIVANIVREQGEEATIALVTADHRIEGVEKFQHDIAQAMSVAEATNEIVVFGISPERPETGYGYIEVGASALLNAFEVAKFHEKPSLEKAEEYVAHGGYYWNSGMFFFTVAGFENALKTYSPDSYTIYCAIRDAADEEAQHLEFSKLRSVSFDYEIMEKLESCKLVPATFGWDDVGAWDALLRNESKDAGGNVTSGNVSAVDCNECVLVNYFDNIKVGVLGLTGIVVVATEDGILVCPAESAQRVKEISNLR